jgi:bifunctional DNA-binding transcriptional regulator/antitoxin component of YhaV-PrlF toxin-antitoxin module
MSFVRIDPANQLTLPEEVSAALQVKEGDFLEITTLGNAAILRPTRMVPFGSPEGEEEDRRAKQDFAEGRYHTFHSLEEFADYLGIPLEEAEVSGVESPSVKDLVEEALSATQGGNTAAAMEFLEQARKSLEVMEIAGLSQTSK